MPKIEFLISPKFQIIKRFARNLVLVFFTLISSTIFANAKWYVSIEGGVALYDTSGKFVVVCDPDSKDLLFQYEPLGDEGNFWNEFGSKANTSEGNILDNGTKIFPRIILETWFVISNDNGKSVKISPTHFTYSPDTEEGKEFSKFYYDEKDKIIEIAEIIMNAKSYITIVIDGRVAYEKKISAEQSTDAAKFFIKKAKENKCI